jgi:hypothetical protein
MDVSTGFSYGWKRFIKFVGFKVEALSGFESTDVDGLEVAQNVRSLFFKR